MKKRTWLGGALLGALAGALGVWLLAAHGPSGAALAAGGGAAQALVDRALSGPAGPDDEGQYKLIDPIGPGGTTAAGAANEVFSSTMIGGLYTRWIPYHDPFSSGGGYDHRFFRVTP